jgi:hypothetical protein
MFVCVGERELAANDIKVAMPLASACFSLFDSLAICRLLRTFRNGRWGITRHVIDKGADEAAAFVSGASASLAMASKEPFSLALILVEGVAIVPPWAITT